MNKKFLALTLLLSVAAFRTQADADVKIDDQNNQKELVENAQKEHLKLTKFYKSLKEEYDSEDVDGHEKEINQELKKYLKDCLVDVENIKNTTGIEKTADKFLKHLCSISDADDAYATASMVFMVNWTNITNDIVKKINSEEEQVALQEATEELKRFVNEVFVLPMIKRAEQLEQ